MMKLPLLTITSLLFSLAGISQSQSYSVKDQGMIRTYLIHLPVGYQNTKSYPLVLNLHGLNSNGAEQEIYSRFDPYADSNGFIVAYPNAVDEAWKIGGDEDVIFLSHLVDTIRTKFSASGCLFVTGMSMGGYMTYKLACALQNKLTAIAVVSGNMSIPLQNTCTSAPLIPVMHFHGTNDPLVNYEGSFGIAPVETTIQWWVMHNKGVSIPQTTILPDLNASDNSNVTKYVYKNTNNNAEVTFYKIIQGGHAWPGAKILLPYGNTNLDIDASAEIAAYFKSFCTGTTELQITSRPPEIKIFPNPTNQEIQIEIHGKILFPTLEIYNATGIPVFQKTDVHQSEGFTVDISSFPPGVYFIAIKENSTTRCIRKFIVVR